jgi:hypothetical protein
VGYVRTHEGWFVEYGRRVGDASAAEERPARRSRRRRAR